MKTCTYSYTVAAIHKLRINVKSLAAEARFIRAETRRCSPIYRNELHLHRTMRLREEARHTQLALAFVRQRLYRTVEARNSRAVDPARIHRKLQPYALGYSLDQIRLWLLQ